MKTEYYFLIHILATAGLSLLLIKQFWLGQSVLTVDTGTGYESQLAISLVAAASSVYVAAYLVKRKKHILRFRAWMLHAVVASLYFFGAFTLLADLVDPLVAFATSVFFGIGFFFAAENRSKTLPVFTLLLSMIVVFPLVLFLPLTWVAITAGVYAIYDIYAVLKGPLGKLVMSLKDRNQIDLLRYSGLGTPIQGKLLGLGDSVFYSALFASVWLNINWVAGLFCLLGISIGFFLTFSLAKTKPMPALPFSVGLGLLFSFLIWAL